MTINEALAKVRVQFMERQALDRIAFVHDLKQQGASPREIEQQLEGYLEISNRSIQTTLADLRGRLMRGCRDLH